MSIFGNVKYFKIYLPLSVFIEDSGSLEVIGVMTGVHNITISNGGVLRLASPVSVNLDILRVEYLNILHSHDFKVYIIHIYWIIILTGRCESAKRRISTKWEYGMIPSLPFQLY